MSARSRGCRGDHRLHSTHLLSKVTIQLLSQSIVICWLTPALEIMKEDDSKLSERTVSEELQQEWTKMNIDGDGFEDIGTVGDKPSEPVLSNGVARMVQEPAEPASPSVHSEQTPHSDSKVIEASITKSDDHDSLGGKSHKISQQSAKKLKNRKDSSLVKSSEATDRSPMDTDKDEARKRQAQDSGRRGMAQRLKDLQRSPTAVVAGGLLLAGAVAYYVYYSPDGKRDAGSAAATNPKAASQSK